jgi:hypothetical protein
MDLSSLEWCTSGVLFWKANWVMHRVFDVYPNEMPAIKDGSVSTDQNPRMKELICSDLIHMSPTFLLGQLPVLMDFFVDHLFISTSRLKLAVSNPLVAAIHGSV